MARSVGLRVASLLGFFGGMRNEALSAFRVPKPKTLKPWQRKAYQHVQLKSNQTSTRVQRRLDARQQAARDLAQYCIRGNVSGGPAWPANMPRKVRRAIVRDAAKRTVVGSRALAAKGGC